MLIHESQDGDFRCCGPAGCGVVYYALDVDETTDRYCVGPRCAAWRWVSPGFDAPPDTPPSHGYFGLAGEIRYSPVKEA